MIVTAYKDVLNTGAKKSRKRSKDRIEIAAPTWWNFGLGIEIGAVYLRLYNVPGLLLV
jgi:hypothetical protein